MEGQPRPPEPAAPEPAQPDPSGHGKDSRNDTLAVIGWVTAVLLPLVGAIIGIVLMNRKDVRGGRILILAGVIFVIGIIVISTSGGDGGSSY